MFAFAGPSIVSVLVKSLLRIVMSWTVVLPYCGLDVMMLPPIPPRPSSVKLVDANDDGVARTVAAPAEAQASSEQRHRPHEDAPHDEGQMRMPIGQGLCVSRYAPSFLYALG